MRAGPRGGRTMPRPALRPVLGPPWRPAGHPRNRRAARIARAMPKAPRELLWRVALGLVGVGMLGLTAVVILFPESNLLGGLALIFAPLLWVGAAMLAGLALAALAAWRRRGKPTPPA